LAFQLAEANRRIGVLQAVNIVKVALLQGTADDAIAMCNELTHDALQPVPAPAVVDLAPELPHAGLVPRKPEPRRPRRIRRLIADALIAMCWRITGWDREFKIRDEEP
jgi:hypothetical protein